MAVILQVAGPLMWFVVEHVSVGIEHAVPVMLQVAGPLMGFVVERVSVGIQHVAALASPADKRTGLPQVQSGLN